MKRALFVLVWLVGCGTSSVDDDKEAPPDAGTSTSLDAGGARDAGETQDAGTVQDAGRADAGITVDAGAPPDGGAPDAGPSLDGGTPAGPPGPDTTMPFPIDRGDEGVQTPGTYKNLPLRVVNNGEPIVAPVDGLIGVVCIGMSNSTQECSEYITQAEGPLAAEINDQVVIVDCAVGGNAIERWNDPTRDARLWDACINQKIPAAGLRPDQVRVIYHKAADQFTTGNGGQALPPYPARDSDYFAFYTNLGTFAQRAVTMFPSVQAMYTTSRMYGGFTTNPARGEPLSYEEGHALNTWLADNPSFSNVWQGWGPYIWAPDCATGETNGSGVCYDRADLQMDGTHPAAGARTKITRMIHARFSQHAWYRP